jgi:hypothetical protein
MYTISLRAGRPVPRPHGPEGPAPRAGRLYCGINRPYHGRRLSVTGGPPLLYGARTPAYKRWSPRSRAWTPLSFLAVPLPAPADSSRARSTGRGGRHRRLPAHPTAGATPPRSTPQTEPLATPRPSPVLSRPRTPASSPNSGEQYRCPRPRDDIAKVKIFPGSFLQKCNSNSVVILLFLVNCVENHRNIGKMQNQLCWIRCELSYNFCYSGLS